MCTLFGYDVGVPRFLRTRHIQTTYMCISTAYYLGLHVCVQARKYVNSRSSYFTVI